MIGTALIIEGDTSQRDALTGMFNAVGVAAIETAATGEQAIASVHGGPWDLVYIDLDMADYSGLRIVDLLATLGNGTGVVIASRHPLRILRGATAYARARGVRVVAALSKPVSQAHLSRALSGGSRSSSSPPPPAAAGKDVAVKRLHALSPGALRRSLQTGPYFATFQPQHMTDTGILRGAEVIANWRLPGGGQLSLAEFLPAFADAGLLEAVTDRMVLSAFDMLRLTQRRHRLVMSVAVPTTVACSMRWAQHMTDMAAQLDIDPRQIVLELTEQGSAPRADTLIGAVTQLRLCGFQCAISDVGLDGPLLGRLLMAPFNELRFGRRWIGQANLSIRTDGAHENALRLAQSLNIVMAAEGIDEEQDLKLARSLGVQVTQGSFHAMPMSHDRFQQYAASHGIVPDSMLRQYANG